MLKKLREIELFEKEIGRRLKRLDEFVKGRIKKFKFMNFIPEGLVGDFGTGIGIDLIALSKLRDGGKFVGIDITSEGLKVAKDLLSKENVYFHLIRADILFPPFRDCVFDALNFSHVLHHHPFSFLKKILKEAGRVSKKGSIVLIAEPSYLDESYEFSREINRIRVGIRDLEKLSSICKLEDLRKLGYDLYVFGYYGNIYPSTLKCTLESNGFKIVKVRIIGRNVDLDEVVNRLKKNIDSLDLDDVAKEYLTQRLEDLKEKYSMINLLYEFTLYVKAVRH